MIRQPSIASMIIVIPEAINGELFTEVHMVCEVVLNGISSFIAPVAAKLQQLPTSHIDLSLFLIHLDEDASQ
eukprot:gnl/Chilomastix_caulleri/4474.p2 GENE.gnl/Chilomastix_caulleri/4474~~gnl/Chilomastix_caulleri/4474.p2  ORF type:complete len:72 (+),score=18.92 gnl/Chilomastix_caulleri/4474:277-492(+)